jgi:hypothetical protein
MFENSFQILELYGLNLLSSRMDKQQYSLFTNPLYTDVTYLAADFTHGSLAMLASPCSFHGLANQLSLGAVEMKSWITENPVTRGDFLSLTSSQVLSQHHLSDCQWQPAP